jgi:hypothetical protein
MGRQEVNLEREKRKQMVMGRQGGYLTQKREGAKDHLI